MRTKLVTTLVFILFSTFLFAQNESASAPQLKNSDVENFIKHFPDIQVELEKLDFDIDPQDDLQSLAEGLESYEEINSIVKKYGYADYIDFAAKSSAIAACYASIKLKGEGVPEIQKAYNKIEQDESMTPEQKQMAKQQLESILSAMGGAFTLMANEQDLETVKTFVPELDVLFDEK